MCFNSKSLVGVGIIGKYRALLVVDGVKPDPFKPGDFDMCGLHSYRVLMDVYSQMSVGVVKQFNPIVFPFKITPTVQRCWSLIVAQVTHCTNGTSFYKYV